MHDKLTKNTIAKFSGGTSCTHATYRDITIIQHNLFALMSTAAALVYVFSMYIFCLCFFLSNGATVYSLRLDNQVKMGKKSCCAKNACQCSRQRRPASNRTSVVTSTSIFDAMLAHFVENNKVLGYKKIYSFKGHSLSIAILLCKYMDQMSRSKCDLLNPEMGSSER